MFGTAWWKEADASDVVVYPKVDRDGESFSTWIRRLEGSGDFD